MARTPPGAVRYDSTRRLPPHLTHSNTSSANVLRSNPGQSSRAVRFFFISCLAAASGASLATPSPSWGSELGSWQRIVSYTTQAGINASPKLVEPVRQALASDGLISFRLDSPGSRSVYDSREYSNTTARWPRLIAYDSLPTATP